MIEIVRSHLWHRKGIAPRENNTDTQSLCTFIFISDKMIRKGFS